MVTPPGKVVAPSLSHAEIGEAAARPALEQRGGG